MRRTSRARARVARLAVSGSLICVAAWASPAAAGPGPAEGGDGRLSDERRTTYWAFSEEREPLRSRPHSDAKVVAKLRLATELGAPEVYVALKRSTDADGEQWLQVRVPGRPNGRVAWVRESALDDLSVTDDRLEISLGHRRATLFEDGKRVWRAPIGIGMARTPTPRGRFYVRERLRLGGGGVYGTFAFGTSAYSPRLSDWPGGGVVGIHGTNQPGLIPGRISHGCVRVRNKDINQLKRLMGLGTPIWIR